MTMDEKMRVVFLDIDSVLNHAAPGLDIYFDETEKGKVPIDNGNLEAFKKVLAHDPDLKVVWSTDWRYYDDELWNGYMNPRLWLEAQDFMKGRIIGKTPQKMSSEHFHDIKWWLDEHDEVQKYVILEDSYFPDKWFGLDKHLVRVSRDTGLTDEDADDAIRILDTIEGDTRHVRLERW